MVIGYSLLVPYNIWKSFSTVFRVLFLVKDQQLHHRVMGDYKKSSNFLKEIRAILYTVIKSRLETSDIFTDYDLTFKSNASTEAAKSGNNAKV